VKNSPKKNICIFVHYFPENFIPLYVIIYLNELKNYFDEILLVTNSRNIENSLQMNLSEISVLFVNNEGYDFGMFYKAFSKINPTEYQQIACINDSNVIFGSLQFLFDWGNRQLVDFWGLVDSFQNPKYSTHINSYHIQSHFMVFNETAIESLSVFMKQIKFDEIIKIENISLLKKTVINLWEIGLTQFLINNNLTCKAYIESKEYAVKYRKGKPVNVPTKLYYQTIADGVPIIKKRVVTSTDLRHLLTFKGNWKRLIQKYGDNKFEIEKMIIELQIIRKKEIKNRFYKIFKIKR
jgi:lipopolysaccharide biosynthesis protein